MRVIVYAYLMQVGRSAQARRIVKTTSHFSTRSRTGAQGIACGRAVKAMPAGPAGPDGPPPWPLHPLRDTPIFPATATQATRLGDDGSPNAHEHGSAGEGDGSGVGLRAFAQNMRQQQARGMTVRQATCEPLQLASARWLRRCK
jgi:hypothetical protein